MAAAAAAAAAATRGGCGWCMVEVKKGGGEGSVTSRALETRGDNTQSKERLVHASAALNVWPGVDVKA